jgi:hypothetical protein
VRGSDPKDMPLGRWPDVTIGEARKRKSAIVASISDGGNPWQERAEERRRKAGSTLNEAFSEWLETVACNKRTRDQDELRYAMNIRGGHRFVFGKWKGRTNKTGIGHLPIAEITRLDPASTVPPPRWQRMHPAASKLPAPAPGLNASKAPMAERIALPAQTWPPASGAYDYVLTLNDEEIAWEGLRRNPDYQRHYRLCAAGHAESRRLPSGQSIWRIASHGEAEIEVLKVDNGSVTGTVATP